MKTLQRSLAAAAALLAAACGTTSYSRIEGERYFQASLDTFPVMVTKIDGESTDPHIPVQVLPGRHAITVQALPTSAQRYGEERTFELDVAPCTRYWVVAVKENRLAADFSVKVDYAEPMAGCTPPKAG